MRVLVHLLPALQSSSLGRVYTGDTNVVVILLNNFDRQVKTVLEKRNNQSGVLKGEKRRGKKKLDPVQKQNIVEHLTRFLRVLPHYCCASSSHTHIGYSF